MKKPLTLLVVLVILVALLTACATTPTPAASSSTASQEVSSTAPASESAQPASAETTKKLIYDIEPTLNQGLKAESDAVVAAAEKMGYEVKTLSHGDDPQKFSDIIDNAISDKAVGIITCNAGADASIEPIQKAKDAGIPTICIGREINASGVALAQIVANNFQGAAAVGEAFVKFMNEEGNYVEFTGIESDNNSQIRDQGFHSVVDKYPELTCINKQTANWDEKQAYDKLETIIQSGKEFKGVFCCNDTMGIGAQKVLLDHNMTDVIVCSFDGFNDVRDSILRGEIKATAMQPLVAAADLAVELLDKYLKEGTTGREEKILMDCVLITKDNASHLDNFMYTE